MEELRLRNYQSRLIDEIRGVMKDYGFRKIAVYSACGSGKSCVCAFMAANAANKGLKVLVLTHRTEILKQNLSKIESLGVKTQIIDSKMKILKDVGVWVGMSQTIASRIKNVNWMNWLKTIDFVIIDELDRAEHNRILDGVREDAYRVGLSATVIRSGSQRQLGVDYDCIVTGAEVSELVNLGFLSDGKYYAFKAPSVKSVQISSSSGDYVQHSLAEKFKKPARYAGVVKEWVRLFEGTCTVVFCVDSQHAIEMCKAFCDKGITAKYLLSDTFPDTDAEYSGERTQLLKDFSDRKFDVLVNVAIATTGFDCSAIQTVVLDFATVSYAKYMQCIGRASRIHKGKTHFSVACFGDNIERFGKFTDAPVLSLWHRSGGNGVCPTKSCPEEKGGCTRLIPVSAIICPYCGYKYPSDQEIYEVQLTELIDDESDMYSSIEKWAASRKLLSWSNNRILMVACMKEKGSEKAAFKECIKVLRTANGGMIADVYWYFFKKQILDKQKRNR